jgi:hypothetical protein
MNYVHTFLSLNSQETLFYKKDFEKDPLSL